MGHPPFALCKRMKGRNRNPSRGGDDHLNIAVIPHLIEGQHMDLSICDKGVDFIQRRHEKRS